MATSSSKRRLSRDDWIEAALERISTGGLSAVSVESIAVQLKTTKGSFYWHFKDRSALVEAAIRRWAIEETTRRIAELNEIDDPKVRLRTLMSPRSRDPMVSRMDLVLSRSSFGDERIRDSVRAHHQLWLEFGTKLFVELGFRRPEAVHRATLAYSAYLGLVSLELTGDDTAANNRGVRDYLRFVRRLLVHGRTGS